LEHAAHPGHQLDIGTVKLNQLCPRTEGPRFIVSGLAPLDSDLHLHPPSLPSTPKALVRMFTMIDRGMSGAVLSHAENRGATAPLGGNEFATTARQDRSRKIVGAAMGEHPGAGSAPAIATDLAAALRWRPASDKFRLLAGIFLALFALYGATYLAVAAAKGWPAGFGDSFALWSFGRYLSDHAAITIYDPIALRTTQLA